MIRPDRCPLGTCFVAAGASWATDGAGGARAAARSGFDSVGGGGPSGAALTAGAGEVGSLTVAAGFSIGCWIGAGACSLAAVD